MRTSPRPQAWGRSVLGQRLRDLTARGNRDAGDGPGRALGPTRRLVRRRGGCVNLAEADRAAMIGGANHIIANSGAFAL